MKTWRDNDMTNCIGAVYTQNETELPCRIEPGKVYDEN